MWRGANRRGRPHGGVTTPTGAKKKPHRGVTNPTWAKAETKQDAQPTTKHPPWDHAGIDYVKGP